jgi:hypothetical protein
MQVDVDQGKKCAYKRNKEEAVGRETPENTPNCRVSSR